ncbi:Transmembrane E3 ubiquitin-protein ligase 1 [Cyberlindnera fabianii]|uniref:RING-type E3 ubiquitin transferase n=1 Tax=Cyberlindnera fabianii TaxID=36022 RepID=A0A1V2L2U2_CYBFA|nr:Transmembrane E3 ubiquitin-protein ligase 1 [Cyberlindnera fabianii]
MDRYNLIFLIIFFTFILPGPPVGPVTSDEQYQKLSLFRSHLYHNYHTLENATFDHNFGNLTGFMLSYDDALRGEENQTYPIEGKDYLHWSNNQSYSILPDQVTEEAQRVWSLESDNYDPSKNFYTNISSSTHGRFLNKNSSFSRLPLQLPPYLEHFDQDLSIPSADQTADYDPSHIVGNITIPEGIVSMDISVVETINRERYNKLDSQIKLVNIDFEFADDNESNKHSIETKGFYFVETGNLITMTSSAKFMSFYGGIQHLTFDNTNFETTKNLSLEYLDHTFFKADSQENNVDISFNYLTQLMEKSTRHCEYVSYFHLNKVNLTQEEMSDIENELNTPIGRPIDFGKIPKLEFSGFLYSPDCAVEISVPSITGVRREVKIHDYHRVVIFGILLLVAQIILTVKQMNFTNTPSTISRISFWSIGMMSLVDGSLAMIYLVSSAVMNQLYLPLTVSAFLSFILAAMFDVRFMISIYMSQINERSLNLFTALQGRPIDDNANTETDTGSQEIPTTRPEIVQQTAGPQDESQVSGTIFVRSMFTLVVFTFVSMNAIIWPRHARCVYEYVVLMVLNSYWLPQAYRNVVRGSHRSFRWWYIAGTTTVRSIPLFYIFVVKNNVFEHHYDPQFFLLIVTWLATQLFILFLQSVFGARFFLPKSLLPQTYNYHPALTEQDLETGFGVDHFEPGEETPLQGDSDSTAHALKHDNGRCVVDCAICMNPVEVPILRSNLDQAATFLQRRTYMVTPCRHIFHTQCLEAWMKYKLQCPTCRNALPPL